MSLTRSRLGLLFSPIKDIKTYPHIKASAYCQVFPILIQHKKIRINPNQKIMDDKEIEGFGGDNIAINIDDALFGDEIESDDLYTGDTAEEDEEY